MTLDPAVRRTFRAILYDLERGTHSLEEAYDKIVDLVRGGVTTQPAPTPDQLVEPAPSG